MGLTCIKEIKVFDEWLDSGAGIWFDDKVHVIGQARNAIYPDNTHYVFDDTTYERLHKITAPFSPDAEMMISKILPGQIVVMTGTSSLSKVWAFNPSIAGYTAGSWYELNSSFLADIGPRVMAAGVDLGSWFYTFGGLGNNTIAKTQDFLSWSSAGTLPTELSYLAAGAFTEHKGKAILGGGATNIASPYSTTQLYEGNVDGHVFVFDPADDSLDLLVTDQAKLGQIWIDMVSNGTDLFCSRGLISTQQLASFYGGVDTAESRYGNNRGVLKSTDDGVTWNYMTLTDGPAIYGERHRAVPIRIRNEAHFFAGFGWNDHWLAS